MARLIFISPYLKGGKNAKWLRNRTHYFATREGVVIPEKDADTPPTEKQKAYIQRLTKNLPLCCGLLEYEDYKEHPTRMTAAEFIAQAYEQFVAPMDKRENYIDYVANRPGAQQVGGHGLWDANGPVKSLREVEEAVSHHAGNVWTPIVSLRREDAERLGYTDVENWRALVCACVGDIAEAYKIHPDHLKWYAALHTKEKHVHIHMILYSTDPREGYLTVQGIRAVKSAFVTKVYENDRISIYEKQTQYRTRLRENAEERMLELIRAMRSGTLQNERMEQLIEELTQRLPLTKGRKVYGYLLPRLKRIVAQLERRRLHRTNGADKILVDVAGGVRLQLVVLAAVRNIIGVGGEENEAVRLAHIERFNNFAAERFAGVRILALRLAQGLEQTVLVAVRDLSGRECNVDEVAPQRAGERLFEQPQIHLLLLLPHEAEGGVDPRDDLAVGVDVAAEDAAEVIFIEPEAPANFVEFFLIHFLLPSLTEYHGEKLYHSVPLAARGTTSIHTEKKNG